MGTILIALLVFVIAMIGLVYVSNIYTGVMINRIVVRKMEWLDFIQETSLVPIDWRTGYEKAVKKISPDDEFKKNKLRAKARKIYLKRLDKVLHFARVTTLVASEAERKIIIRTLEEIHEDWKENDNALFKL